MHAGAARVVALAQRLFRCAHKLYGDKVGMPYLPIMGLFGIGRVVELVSPTLRSNPYYAS